MTGFVTACWLLTVGLANLFINASVDPPLHRHAADDLLRRCWPGRCCVTVAFVFVARRFNRGARQGGGEVRPSRP